MKKNISKYQKRLIEEHNAKMKIIQDTSRVTGLSEVALFYCAHFGIMGMPWVIEK